MRSPTSTAAYLLYLLTYLAAYLHTYVPIYLHVNLFAYLSTYLLLVSVPSLPFPPGLHPGDNVVVMVTNAGEMDLLLNFVCSCKHHNISMNNVLVFTGSRYEQLTLYWDWSTVIFADFSPMLMTFIDNDIAPMVEATGAAAVYPTSFAAVSRSHSTAYLDKVRCPQINSLCACPTRHLPCSHVSAFSDPFPSFSNFVVP